MDNQNGTDERSFDAALHREMEYLLASSMFRKSPRLSQLLAYLVGATLRGEGETLKSYTVAVDGLGRSADFDAQADSYPRVQVMRLRNFLASFYARYEPVGELCIYLLPGSYRVRMAKFAIAYPDIVERNGRSRLAEGLPFAGLPPVTAHAAVTDATPVTPAAASMTSQPTDATAPLWWSRMPFTGIASRKALSVGVVIVALLGALSIGSGSTLSFARIQGEADRGAVPTILISEIAGPRDPASRDIAIEIHHALENGVAQSWVVDPLGSAEAERAGSADYRLDANLSSSGPAGSMLLAELVERQGGRIIWSKRLPLDVKRPVPDQLDGLLAQIAGPTGAIGERELDRADGETLDGYRCLLASHSLLAEQNLALRSKVKNCLGTPLDHERLEAVRLAQRSFLLVQDSLLTAGIIPYEKAEQLAQQAIETDSYEMTGYFAMAWLKYSRNQCEAGNGHASRALALNAFEPSMLAFLGNFASECKSLDGPRFIEKALASHDAGSPTARLPIIQLALKYDRPDVLATIGRSGSGALNDRDPAFHLGEAILAAHSGDVARARRHWQRFVAIQSKPGDAPDQLLRNIIFSASGRQKIVDLLQQNAVIATRPAAAT